MKIDMGAFNKIFNTDKDDSIKLKERDIRLIKRVRSAIAQYKRVGKQELSLELQLSAYSVNKAIDYLLENKMIKKEIASRQYINDAYHYYI